MFKYVREIWAKAPEFVKERSMWITAGRPIRKPEKIKELYLICSKNECGHFEGNKCGLCGCGLHPSNVNMNKLAWATTSCPNEPKFWEADVVVEEENVSQTDAKLALEEHQKDESSKKGCGCAKVKKSNKS